MFKNPSQLTIKAVLTNYLSRFLMLIYYDIYKRGKTLKEKNIIWQNICHSFWSSTWAVIANDQLSG